ncbi:hypothetical protein ACN47E_004358 [Coniothyrium glycines]
MRRPSACSNCRARRRKCNYPPDGTASTCLHCASHGLRCVQMPPEGGYYARRLAKHREDTNTQTDTASSQSDAELPPMALRLALVNLYFDYIHDQYHSVYQRTSFLRDVENSNVPAIILFAMFALSSRFSTDEVFRNIDPRERGEMYRVSSENLFKTRELSPTMVQACLLLGAYASANGDTDVENMYYSLGGRMCLNLDLPNRPVVSLLEREMNIRTWWSFCMVDVWSSAAVKLPRIMPKESDVPMPIDELPFSSMSMELESHLRDSSSASSSPLLAEMIKLNRILAKIIEFNRACVSEQLDSLPLELGVRDLARDLDMWLEHLPESMRDTPTNFEWYASRGLGRMFAAVYLGYYHYGQLLYYQFLSSTHELPSTATQYALACKDHAARLCSMVYRTFATPGSEVMYSAVAHILVIASTVQIHTLLFSGDEHQIRVSKTRLERNFEIILKLRTYWTSVDSALSRLRAFHQTCLRSKDTSFVLDRWLLRFLVQFAPHMELEPRDNDPKYEALWSLSKQSPLSGYSGISL